ncbi:MAG: glycerate kinase [Kiritimatiellae bacterium]|nr:glycerate kinase [Kiritimatiellia bacterium]
MKKRRSLKIAIASDSFKGSMSADQATRCIEAGLLRALPTAHCIALPMADGGEGTVDAMVASTGGRLVRRRVRDPLGRSVSATFGISGDGSTAIIEMAAASGLPLLRVDEQNPLKTTSVGTGELIRHALDAGVASMVVGLGGSATVDGGVGMAQALGARFRDGRGREVGPGGGALVRLDRIDVSAMDPRLSKVNIQCACDVRNPLTGPRGAAQVFGPQKGASPAAVKRLDANLRHLAKCIRRDLGVAVSSRPGAGAAGGLGAGMIAFLNAELCSGVDLVMQATGFAERIRNCDLVITGEGRMDRQTAFGKTPSGVARTAAAQGIPVVAICGCLDRGFRAVHDVGIDAVLPATGFGRVSDEKRDRPRELRDCAEQVGRLLALGRTLGVSVA